MNTIFNRKLAALMTIVSIVILAPLFTLFESSFSAHMILHIVLVDGLAPSLVVGVFFLWLLPSSVLAKMGTKVNLIRHMYGFLTRPIVAFSLSTIFLWFSHIPLVFNLTLSNDLVHAVIHLGLVVTAIFYWQPLTNAGSKYPHLASNESRVLYLMANATQSAVLGALIAFSKQVLFTDYLRVLSYSAALLDQQLGGAIMLLSGPLIYVPAIILSLRTNDEGDSKS